MQQQLAYVLCSFLLLQSLGLLDRDHPTDFMFAYASNEIGSL
jgi:hypothetical protein